MGFGRHGAYNQKELASKVGPIVIEVPQDRKSKFAPTIIKMRHNNDIGGFEELILSVYTKGMATRDMSLSRFGDSGSRSMPKRLPPPWTIGRKRRTKRRFRARHAGWVRGHGTAKCMTFRPRRRI